MATRRRAAAAMLTVAALLALAGCQSPREACQKAHPTDPSAANACFQAVLQRQNQQENYQDTRDRDRD
jgi:hypothetical protein